MTVTNLLRSLNTLLLPPDVRVTLPDSALERLVGMLRVRLSDAEGRRREIKSSLSSKRPATCPNPFFNRATSPHRSSRPRELSLGLDTNVSRDIFLKSAIQSDKCRLDSYFSQVDDSNKAVIHRVNSKITQLSRCGKAARNRSCSVTTGSSSRQHEKGERSEMDLQETLVKLRLRVREVKVAEDRQIREVNLNAKQLLTEYSAFGMKIKDKKNVEGRPKTSFDPLKEIVSLIEVIDSSLSTSEALAILKELGVDYKPRSVEGRKNAMATDLSAALAPNGLHLANLPGIEGENSNIHM